MAVCPHFDDALSSAPTATSAAAASDEPARPRVTFADVLASSLRPVTEMRAWFNEDRGRLRGQTNDRSCVHHQLAGLVCFTRK